MKLIQTMSKGSSWHNIKPYPVLILDALVSKGGNILEFIVSDKFIKLADGTFQLRTKQTFTFNPNAVVITDELKEELDALSYVLPPSVFEVPKKSEAEVVIVRRGGVMTDLSECPGFKKHWDPDVQECKDCSKVFSEEYLTCKKVCLEKIHTELNKPIISEAPSKDTAEPNKPSAQSITKSFDGFRPGSRADVLLKFLESKQKATISDAAIHLAQTCTINVGKALENVKGYVWEWSKGMWGGQVKDFKWSVAISGEEILYAKKGT